MLKAVIFDFDGTIANTLPICIGAFTKTIAPVINRTPTVNEIYSYFGPTEEGIFLKHFPNQSQELIQTYLKHYAELHTEETALAPGLIEIIRALLQKGVRVGLVTAKGPKSCKISLDYYQIANVFETIEVGSPTNLDKSEKIAKAMKTLNVTPQETAYIGDSPKDITSSHEAGTLAWGAAWFNTAKPEKILENNPDEIFYTIEEFKTRLEKEFGTLD